MIVLAPMTAAEFAAYLERAVPDYADDKVASGQWSAASALARSRAAYAALLPDGLATPDHVLSTVRDATNGASLGVLWYAVRERADRRIAYVYDILIEPRYRRRGHASAAFEALEAEARSRGLDGIALHVFGHNEAARALYARLGYAATNIDMFKKVADASG